MTRAAIQPVCTETAARPNTETQASLLIQFHVLLGLQRRYITFSRPDCWEVSQLRLKNLISFPLQQTHFYFTVALIFLDFINFFSYPNQSFSILFISFFLTLSKTLRKKNWLHCMLLEILSINFKKIQPGVGKFWILICLSISMSWSVSLPPPHIPPNTTLHQKLHAYYIVSKDLQL